LLLALAGPVIAAAVLLPARGRLENTQVALILVVVVVGVAAFGRRVAGYLASVVAGLSFNFFFTEPFHRLAISDRSDVVTFLLLMVVGVVVTELAVWGRRQQARAGQEAGFLAGIHAAAAASTAGRSPQALIRQVGDELRTLLELRGCRFEAGVAGVGGPARLHPDGSVTWHGERPDVARNGFPPDADTELLVHSGGRLVGRFLLTPTPGRPVPLERRRVAVTLADQIGNAYSL
jgi:hypothetical protein